jgi:predicted dithiol-disulfide oxidoreductase (DUF899 family)
VVAGGAAARRELLMKAVEKACVFAAPSGPVSLGERFGRHPQLIVVRFMFDPAWNEGCKGCSHLADNYDGAVVSWRTQHRVRRHA